MGSRRAARQAGMHAASVTSAATAVAAPASVAASLGDKPNNKLRNTPVLARLIRTPLTRPIVAKPDQVLEHHQPHREQREGRRGEELRQGREQSIGARGWRRTRGRAA